MCLCAHCCDSEDIQVEGSDKWWTWETDGRWETNSNTKELQYKWSILQSGRANYNSRADLDWSLKSTITKLSTLNWCMSVLGITAPEGLILFSLEQCTVNVLPGTDLKVALRGIKTWKWTKRTLRIWLDVHLLWTLYRQTKGHLCPFITKGGKTVVILSDMYSSDTKALLKQPCRRMCDPQQLNTASQCVKMTFN